MRSGRQGWLALLTGALLLGCGCGEPEASGTSEAGTTPGSVRELPADPVAALAWIEVAGRAEDGGELDRRLALWPLTDDAFVSAEQTQVVLTWRLQRALADKRLEAARDAYQALRTTFGGEGRTRLGRRITSYGLRIGLATAYRKAALAAIEGGVPDPERAALALKLAKRYLPENEVEEARQLAGVTRWIQADRLDELGAGLPTHAGPQVIVWADTFALGEAVLPSVLRRWIGAHASSQLRITIVPVITGQTRVGLRRVPAAHREAELDVFRAAAKTSAVELGPPTELEFVRALGRAQGSCLMLICDRRGRIVGRLSGHTLDPREVENVLQRVVSR